MEAPSLEIYRRVLKAAKQSNILFSVPNTLLVRKLLSKIDHKEYPVDVSVLDWFKLKVSAHPKEKEIRITWASDKHDIGIILDGSPKEVSWCFYYQPLAEGEKKIYAFEGIDPTEENLLAIADSFHRVTK